MVIVPKKASCIVLHKIDETSQITGICYLLKTRLLLPNDDWVAFCLMSRFAPNMESFWRNSSSLVAVVEVAWVIWSGRASLSVKTRWTTRTLPVVCTYYGWEGVAHLHPLLDRPGADAFHFFCMTPANNSCKKWLQIIRYYSWCHFWRESLSPDREGLLLKLNTIFFFAAKMSKKLLMTFLTFS